MKKILIPASLMVLALLCFSTFAMIGSYIDAEGFLIESFFLVLLGYLFLTISLVWFLVLGVSKLLLSKK